MRNYKYIIENAPARYQALTDKYYDMPDNKVIDKLLFLAEVNDAFFRRFCYQADDGITRVNSGVAIDDIRDAFINDDFWHDDNDDGDDRDYTG